MAHNRSGKHAAHYASDILHRLAEAEEAYSTALAKVADMPLLNDMTKLEGSTTRAAWLAVR